VQTQLASQTQAGSTRRPSEALLTGKLYDDRGHRMTPTWAAKGDKRFRYYVSQALLQGRRGEAGSCRRVPAEAIEAIVAQALAANGVSIYGRDEGASRDGLDAHLPAAVEHITVGASELAITLRNDEQGDETRTIQVPFSQPRRGGSAGSSHVNP
jgi:hypothetical protein